MEEWIPWQNSADEKSIEIIIHCIENVIIKKDVNVTFVIEHKDVILGESNPTLIKSDMEELSVYRIDFMVNIPLVSKDREALNAIVSIPILIKAMQMSENGHDEQSMGSTVEIKKKSIFSTQFPSPPQSVPLGMCNLDLMPLVLGEQSFTEKLILETPMFSFDGASVSWQNLPRLTVTASQIQQSLFASSEIVNFLSVTVESIYNLPEMFTNNLNYVAGTIAYTTNEVPENIIFEKGAWTKYRDVERTKRWNTLRHIENRAQLSKYKLDCDYMGIRNEFKNEIDLMKLTCEDTPRIEWNSVNRCIVFEEGIEAMKHHINKYRYWPFQFQVTDNAAVTKTKGATSIPTQTYQCYVDVSELLFPGSKYADFRIHKRYACAASLENNICAGRSCRIVGQLHEYNPSDINDKIGLENNIFPADDKETKDKKAKVSKVNLTLTDSETFETGLVAENLGPTVIVLQIELFEPLVACRIEEDFSHLISEVLPKVEKKPQHAYTSDGAEAQYIHCVKKLAEVLTENYRDFREENERKKDCNQEEKYCFAPESDELTCFIQYLYKTGSYLSVRNTLKMKVPMLIDQKFKLPKTLVESRETHTFIAAVYTYLVEEMHIGINSMVEGRHAQDLLPDVDSKALYLYAEEAYELGDLDVAKQHYTKVISSNKADPHPWARYAIFLKNIGDIDRAKESCLEAIALDRQNILALLVYAMTLFESKQYKEAEIFFRAITDLHPRSYEGWAILHLFYIRTEYYPGIDFTYRIAEKCKQDKNNSIIFDQEPLSWSVMHYPQNNLYMTAVIFLLKLRFCEFAEIALAQEMENSNRSIHVLYYVAVEHYLSGRYEDALSHLNEAKCIYGMDYSISSLMGHCHFKMGHTTEGVECYEFARMLFDRPDNLHLVEVRLGYHYYNTGDFERAKKVFLNASNTTPTSLTWLGVGISCYELCQFNEAELSLLEANRIDNHNPEIWGYLCLLNMTLRRYDEFSQCYAEMLKNNLNNRKLWLRLTNLMEALDYTPPNATKSGEPIDEYSTEDSEEQ